MLHGGKPELDVYICKAPPDLPDRIRRFDAGISEGPAKAGAMKFAHWSYMRYLNYLAADDIEAEADPIGCWNLLREQKHEAYILFEAWKHGALGQPSALAAILLLRSGWNGDIAIDFVVSVEGDNKRNGIKYAGRKLVAVAMQFAEQANGADKHVFVETAKDSTDWWRHINPREKLGDFLDCGTAFIRHNNVAKAGSQIRIFLGEIGSRVDYAI